MPNIQFDVPPQNLTPPDLYNILFVNGDIHDGMAIEVCQRLLSIEFINKSNGIIEPITMFINSPGGEVPAAWQICDMMDFIETPVNTVGMGEVASAALMILMNGSTRKVTDRTSIMTHRYSWGVSGSHSTLVATAKQFDIMHEKILKHYSECTGLEKEIIINNLLTEHDIWMTPKEAKKYNLVDEIVTSNKTKRLQFKKKNKKEITNDE